MKTNPRSQVWVAPLPARPEFLQRRVDAGGVRLGETRYPEHLRVPEHRHRNPTMTASLGGSFQEVVAGHTICSVEAGAILLRPPGAIHANRIGPGGARNLEIELDDSWGGAAELRIAPRPWATRGFAGLVRSLRSEMRAEDEARCLVIEGLVLELLGRLMRTREARATATRAPAWLRRARERIHDTFREGLRIRAMAAEASVHPVYFSRAFRAHFSESPGECVRRLRIEWCARELLARPDRSVTDIALEAGFCDHSHFARTFTAAMGTSPSEYRRRMAG